MTVVGDGVNTVALPDKYAHLLSAQQAGLRVPPTQWLANGLVTDEATLAQFIAQFPAEQTFIVRSAAGVEDGGAHSHAGHFWSSGAVAAEALPETIQYAYQENRRILHALAASGLAIGTAKPCLMVQPFIRHTVGGVLFLPWSFFSDYACVEYSNQGVQQVVAGDAQLAVIAVRDATPDPLPLLEEQAALMPQLRQLCRTLQSTFGFAVDCEWAFDPVAHEITVLQVRPQTHALGAVLPLPASPLPSLALPEGAWQFTALSDSLGKLSPLSFSLLCQLYTDAIPLLRGLGYRAAQVDFLVRLPDGTVLVDVQREQQFYAATRWGGFWRGFRSPGYQAQAQALFQQASGQSQAPFEYERLATYFGYWWVANLLAAGQGREIHLPAHAYEAAWVGVPGHFGAIPETGMLASDGFWARANGQLRQLYRHEFAKLRQQVAQAPHLAFCSWEEYRQAALVTSVDKETLSTLARQRQRDAARPALYDYTSYGQPPNTAMQSLSVAQVVRGVVRRLDPTERPIPFPAGCILAIPYLPAAYIAYIRELQGIVVLQGSRLSHAAIVAREYGVPYVVVSPTVFASLDDGLVLNLDSVHLQITPATTPTHSPI